jgi:hypothetical protein
LGLRDQFNQILKAQGRPTIDKFDDWFRFLARRSDRYIEDIYEASSFLGAGLDIGANEAFRTTAAQIGAPGEQVDVTKLVQQIRSVKDFIAPELFAAGITDSDLAILEGGGTDVKNLSPTLQQILRNRQALSGLGTRQPREPALPGRTALYPAIQ